MKKIISAAIIMMCLIITTGCKNSNSNEKVLRDFALKFGTMAENKNLDGIREVYPNAGDIESISLNFNKDKIEIFPEEDNVYKIKYNADAMILVRLGLNDAVEVLSSKGIIKNKVPESETKTVTVSAPKPTPAPKPAPEPRVSVFSDGYNVLNGSFNFQGATYGFIITFNYNSSTGRISDAMYKATGYGAGSANKINSMTVSANGRNLSISGPSLRINASGNGSGSFSGSMTRGTHSGSCSMWL